MDEQGEWVVIGLDETLAKRQGLPAHMPIPKAEFDSLAEKGLPIASARKWVTAFLASPTGRSQAWRTQNAAVAARLLSFSSKVEFFDRAQKAFAKNDFPAAISALQMVARVDPLDHAAKLNLASALANQGDHAGAKKIFDEITPTFQGDAEFHVAVAHVHIALNDIPEAAEQMAVALEADPSNRTALDALVKLGVLVPVYENPRDASSLVYLRSDAVLGALEETWSAEPRTAGYFLEQLTYHEAERRSEIALAAADHALAASPTPQEADRARVGRMTALRALGRGDIAEREVREVLEKNPGALWALVELGASLRARGSEAEAIEQLDRALAIDPNDQLALALRFWPDNTRDVAAVGEAIPPLAAFVESHPTSAGAVWSLARAKVAVGSDDEALALFEQALAIAPEDDEIRAEQWAELLRQRKLSQVIAEAAKVTDLPKRSWKLRWNEAEAYASLGKAMEARAAFSAINFDDSLPVEVRKKAKRAVKDVREPVAAT